MILLVHASIKQKVVVTTLIIGFSLSSGIFIFYPVGELSLSLNNYL